MRSFQGMRIHTVEGQPQLRFDELTLDDLDPGDVVVRVAYSAVNYKDAMAAQGIGRNIRTDRPCVAGIEMSGVVVQSNSPNVKEGDRVIVGSSGGYGADHDGGFAEYTRVRSDWLVPVPDCFSLKDVMVIGGAGITAALSLDRLERAGLSPEQGPVVITGATGGVGSICLDLFSGRGYHVDAVTGKASATEYLLSLGATSIVPRDELMSGNKPLAKGRWAGAVENVGGAVLDRVIASMLPHGRVAVCGMAVGYELSTTVLPLVLRAVDLLGINASRSFSMEERRRIWHRLSTDLKPRNLDKIARVMPFDKLPTLFGGFIDSTVTGRTVVEIGGQAVQQ